MLQRVSVTTIEKFRRFMTEASVYDTEESLIESIKGLFRGNDKTVFGGCYHELIEGKYETGPAGDLQPEFKTHDLIFSLAQARPALDYREQHPLMVHEMPVNEIFETKYFPIQVTGRIDGLEGMIVRDPKTRFRNFTTLEYMNSCQWKFYLRMLGLDVFYYDIFEVQGFEGLPFQQPPYKVTGTVLPPVAIRCDRYIDMEADTTVLLNDFLDYVHNRNLLSFLKPALETEIFNF